MYSLESELTSNQEKIKLISLRALSTLLSIDKPGLENTVKEEHPAYLAIGGQREEDHLASVQNPSLTILPIKSCTFGQAPDHPHLGPTQEVPATAPGSSHVLE